MNLFMEKAGRIIRVTMPGLISLLSGLLLMSMSCLADTSADWSGYKQRFVTPEGRVVDTFNKISHSEGQGWGMLFAQANDDPQTFESMWRWTRKNLARKDNRLFSWRYDSQSLPAVTDPNNASDGDILIAWALHKAAQRWKNPNYAAASAAIRRDIHQLLIRQFAGYTVLLPGLSGFDSDHYVDINLSYWVIPAFNDFAKLEPELQWQALVRDGQKLLALCRFGELKLPTDWIRLEQDAKVSPTPEKPSRFSYDAVRIPMYFVWGRALTPELKQPFLAFWPQGQVIADWVDVKSGEKANYPASSGIKAVQALLHGDSSFIAAQLKAEDDYYAASLLMLSKLAAQSVLTGPAHGQLTGKTTDLRQLPPGGP